MDSFGAFYKYNSFQSKNVDRLLCWTDRRQIFWLFFMGLDSKMIQSSIQPAWFNFGTSQKLVRETAVQRAHRYKQ